MTKEKIEKQLERLKKALHPSKPLNIIDQCRIVHNALGNEAPFMENREGLARYLDISSSKVYQMNYIHEHMIPPLKEWFRDTDYQCHKTYRISKLDPEAQRTFLREQTKG